MKTKQKKGIKVQLTTGNDPADLGAGNLEEDAKGSDPGSGVQNIVKRPHQEPCRDGKAQTISNQWEFCRVKSHFLVSVNILFLSLNYLAKILQPAAAIMNPKVAISGHKK